MNKILVVALLALSLATSGCISTITPHANISDINEVDMTSNFKEGESCAWWLFFNLLGPFGDMSVVKAAQSAGIREVEIVDNRIESYIIVSRICAQVYGK